MRKLLKHADVLALAAVVAAVLGTVIVLDRKGADADESGLLAGSSALYQGRPLKPNTDPAISAQSAIPETPVQVPKDADTVQARLPLPKPYEKDVVHLGHGASLGGKLPFPPDNPWNQPIDHLPVDPMSDVIINKIGRDKNVHPDFGSGEWNGAPIGIPYVVVSGTQPKAPIAYTAYGDESDPGPYPIPGDAMIEGDPNVDGDRHVLVIDRDDWKLYELFRAFPIANGRLWRAECGAIFDLKTNDLRPEGWTSADAAGLPIFPGLARYDEIVEQKEIKHALRFTVAKTRRAYVPPARHWASRHTDPSLPPLGMRVRLKKDFDLTPFPPEAQVVLTALKKYGMFLADNGSDWFISGAPDPRWNDDALRTLKKVHGGDFEVVQMEGLVSDQ
ncbi:hypothetical protein [Planctomicrobium sp. SH664]|uniref:hypothetical protein n=1 Tax=Planctomicrobium sp. SH664 TaxID=3448125 RepID=UPI003F5B0BF5